MCLAQCTVRSARVNSDKSSTYRPNVSQSSIAVNVRASESTRGAAAVRLLTVDEESSGQRLDNYLMRLLKGVPKTHVYRVIRSGEVRVNKGRAGADTRVAAGDLVRVPPMRVAEPSLAAASAPAREFDVLLEDEQLLAMNKPAGVAVHGGSGVSYGVIEQLRRARPQARYLELVHRLDKETSGVLLLAKKRSALTALQDQFRARATDKTYSALVWGAWPAKLKVLDLALHKTLDAAGERQVRVVGAEHEAGRRSITLVKVISPLADVTLLDVTRYACTWPTAATPSSATPNTATLRAINNSPRKSVLSACFCMPATWPLTTPAPASASACMRHFHRPV
jgi:23S rRNA pseudouridine955/2504/2580 synthase